MNPIKYCKYWLDYVNARLSMYRAVTLSLLALLFVALILAVFNEVPHSPYAIAFSAMVLVVASYLSNRAIGWLFGVRPHGESAIITALLLLFIFPPREDLLGLAILALVATFGSASKYVLAWRGKHIFNPAAVAAVIIALVGLAYSTWWVSTPALLPITLLGALLILYKTRRLPMALLFTGISVPLILVVALFNQQTITSGLLDLISWPIFFFVGFMVSEPLTLPPRKWQQWAVAALVAVLFVLPIKIGYFPMTPELALVVGNSIAFFFGLKRAILLEFVAKKQLTPSSIEFAFRPQGGPLKFEAGQYTELMIPHAKADQRGYRRMFSLASVPGEELVRFGAKFAPKKGSSFKKAMRHLQPGHVISATGIFGDFVLPKDTSVPLLFVAGGIGITPFISHIETLRKKRERRDIVLVYGAPDIHEVAYFDELADSGIKVVVALGEGTAAQHDNIQLEVSPHIDLPLLQRTVPDFAERMAYISGPPAMVDAVKSGLKKHGVKHIKTDYFTGY